MSQFDKLLGELGEIAAEQDALTKALPTDGDQDDKNIQAAAGEGDGEGDDDGDENGGGAGDGDGDEGGEPMGKSFALTLEDGTVIQAQDGTELVKSLMEQVGALKASSAEAESKMAKALEQTLGVVKSQGELIKSLTEKYAKLAGEGRGRKAVLSVTEKPAPAGGDALAKSDQGMTGEEFMAKASAAFDSKKISGVELTAIDVALRSKTQLDPALIRKVLS